MTITLKNAAIAVTAVAALGLIGCSSNSSNSSKAPQTKVMVSDGVSYQYPDAWDVRPDITTKAQTGKGLWQQAVGASDIDIAILTAYDVGSEVTPQDLPGLQSEVEGLLKGIAEQAGGSVTSAVTIEKTAGYPGFTQQLTIKTPDGKSVQSTVWLFFKGNTQFFLNCQYQSDTQTQTLAGCDTIRTTFKVTS